MLRCAAPTLLLLLPLASLLQTAHTLLKPCLKCPHASPPPPSADPDNNMIEVCNCDCLPVIPLEAGGGYCQGCAGASPRPAHSEDEAMSPLSRDSLDSVRSQL